jgi:hypothetical protein
MFSLRKILKFFQKPLFILGLILISFFLKGVLLSVLFPIFDGQDESRHYNTIQYLSEPKEKNWPIATQNDKQNKNNLATYRYSEEIKQTAIATDNNALRGDIFNTIDFSNSSIGKNEQLINQRLWKPYNFISPPDIVFGTQLYHSFGALIEKTFSQQSILVRFYLLRIFSVFLGTLTVLFAYLIARGIGFSEKHSLLITAIVSFQPKFSFYYSNINYDALLILMFSIFTYFGILTIKKGLNWKNLALLIISSLIAFLTKKTGAILFVVTISLTIVLLNEKIKHQKNKKIKNIFYFISVASLAFVLIYLSKYVALFNESFFALTDSLSNYLSKSLTMGRFALSARTYWGTLSWVNSWFMDYVIDFIWIVEILSVVGLGFLLFDKKEKVPEFLPERKYLFFLISMIVALQLGIRTADWSVFSTAGKLSLGAPGRYFLPNLTTHILVVFSGLGMLFFHFKKKHYFERSLIIGTILMFSFTLYLIFDVVIFRFYL